jgi:hypothetical protein
MTNARLTSAAMCFTGEIEGDRTSLVPWWSITKSILAAAVLKLAETEKLPLAVEVGFNADCRQDQCGHCGW